MTEIHGWGRYPVIEAQIHYPDSRSSAQDLVRRINSSTVIGRGLGRSYGDSSLAPQVLDTEMLNLLHSFNPETGIVCCGAGVTFADLLEVFLPLGWFPPITPGTKFVTVGGAIASDIHGKNHHLHGCFSEYVEQFNILISNGEILRCSRMEHADLFHATCGGMGLTGLVLDARFRLKPVRSAYVDCTILKSGSLEETLALITQHHDSTYTVAWIDCLAQGAALGRALISLGEHAESGELTPPQRRDANIPLDVPKGLLNSFTIRAFNALYYHRISGKSLQQTMDYDKFFYPLDRIHQWNRLYGKNGFVQYQFVIPTTAGMTGMSTFLRKIADSRAGSFLAVLKILGKENNNLLSFPMEGYALALDFQITPGLFELLDELDSLVLHHGGRIYLAKDARMSASTFQKTYPRLPEFRAIRTKYGAEKMFSSCQSLRLGI